MKRRCALRAAKILWCVVFGFWVCSGCLRAFGDRVMEMEGKAKRRTTPEHVRSVVQQLEAMRMRNENALDTLKNLQQKTNEQLGAFESKTRRPRRRREKMHVQTDEQNADGEKANHRSLLRSDPSTFTSRQQHVVDAFLYSWEAYEKYAWGHDEAKPISKSWSKWFDVGLTLVDSLDTLWLMGLDEKFGKARAWVRDDLTFERNIDVNLFECTIRVLGGLLSAHALTGDALFLEKAEDLGKRLLPAFSSSSGIPYSDVNIGTGNAHAPKWGGDSSTAEVTTIQIEFAYLSALTGNPVYWNSANKVNDIVATLSEHRDPKYLLPIFINADSARLSGSATISLGARGDSYYEYLLKQWLLSGKRDETMRIRYMNALEAIEEHLIARSSPSGYVYVAEMKQGRKKQIPKMDHLVCFLPGVIALGAANAAHKPHGKGEVDAKRMQLARDILETCIHMYEDQVTGLAPEIVFFKGGEKDIHVKPADAHNLLRPETVESLFILYRLTMDESYRSRGWQMFQNFRKYCKVPTGGYSSINSVLTTNVAFRDKMESFWLAETLKYFFLLFDDSGIPVDLTQLVLNTEAHPLPIDPVVRFFESAST